MNPFEKRLECYYTGVGKIRLTVVIQIIVNLLLPTLVHSTNSKVHSVVFRGSLPRNLTGSHTVSFRSQNWSRSRNWAKEHNFILGQLRLPF